MKNFSSLNKNRRGLSSIVGALIFVVLMVAAFAVVGTSLDSQTDIVDTGRVVADAGLKKQQEKFSIDSIVQYPGDSLQINVTNSGQNPVEIFTLIITNSSDIANGYPTQTFEIPSNTSFLAPNSETPTDIVKTLDLKLADNPTPELYQFKIISSLGNIQKLFVVCQDGACGLGGGGSGVGELFAQFLLDGPNGVNTKTSTALMFVTNIGEGPLTDVAPLTPCSSMFSVTPVDATPADFNPCDLSPASIDTLQVGQTAMFQWDGTITGEVDDVFQFCNTAQGFDPSMNPVNSLPVCDELTIIDPNDCGGCGPGGQTIILIDDLLIRPALFMTIPSPWGDDDTGNSNSGLGLWGVNMVNPTEKEMNVNKVTVVAYPPGANSQDEIIPNDCNLEEVYPQDGKWSCPRVNTIMWQDIQNPLTIDPYSSLPFLVKVEPGKPAAGTDIDALIVQANAQTTAGSFGKADYQSTMYDAEEVIANVFLTDNATSRLAANIQSQRLGLTELVPEEFKITLADMDFKDSTYIRDDARLIINVPRDWSDVNITDSTGFDDCFVCSPDDRVIGFSDNSTQIIVHTSIDIGGYLNGASNQDTYTDDALTLTFTATPPLNDKNGNHAIPERLYIMYVLADGETGHVIKNPPAADVPDPKPIGPLMEIPIQVLQP